jgi:hypothetical protein
MEETIGGRAFAALATIVAFAYLIPARHNGCDVVVGPNGLKIKSEQVLGMAISA